MATLISHSIYNQLAVVLPRSIHPSLQHQCSIRQLRSDLSREWSILRLQFRQKDGLTLVERVCESPSFRLPPCLQWTCLYYLLIYCKCPLRMYIQVFTIWRCVRIHCNLQGAAFTLSTARGRIKIWMADVVSWRKVGGWDSVKPPTSCACYEEILWTGPVDWQCVGAVLFYDSRIQTELLIFEDF